MARVEVRRRPVRLASVILSGTGAVLMAGTMFLSSTTASSSPADMPARALDDAPIAFTAAHSGGAGAPDTVVSGEDGAAHDPSMPLPVGVAVAGVVGIGVWNRRRPA